VSFTGLFVFYHILAGHSQGVSMVGQFVYENPDLIDKLILIGTSHPPDISLAKRKLRF
jgi:pimeloyl-ACP methyl ester carboxylesterase